MNKNPLTTFTKNVASALLFSAFCASILGLALRGLPGNPSLADLSTSEWQAAGPFELSPERGRYALLYSLLEDNSYHFSPNLASFAAPDVGINNGKFVSLFAPGLSYALMPGYLVGKMFGAAQLGTYATVAIFAILNALLIRSIARHLGASNTAASLAALVFVFATPAFAYAVSLYQHHLSTFLILLSIELLIRVKKSWLLAPVWFLCALSLPIDNPNLFMMFPIGVFALSRIVTVSTNPLTKNKTVTFKFLGLFAMSIMAIPIVMFLYFNQQSYGSPFKLGGTAASGHELLGTTQTIDPADQNARVTALSSSDENRSAVNFFQTRDMLNGFITLITSQDRGLVMYAPVLLFGLLGIVVLHKKNPAYAALFLAISASNLVVYMMWGDPYGGWAFGARYLIPSYAIMTIFLALALSTYRKWWIYLPFLIVLIYCLSINTIGAISSNRNPPKTEILVLEKLTQRRERYTFTRNMEMLDNGLVKSFVWQTFFKSYLTSWEYAWVLIVLLGSVSTGLLAVSYFSKETVTTRK